MIIWLLLWYYDRQNNIIPINKRSLWNSFYLLIKRIEKDWSGGTPRRLRVDISTNYPIPLLILFGQMIYATIIYKMICYKEVEIKNKSEAQRLRTMFNNYIMISYAYLEANMHIKDEMNNFHAPFKTLTWILLQSLCSCLWITKTSSQPCNPASTRQHRIIFSSPYKNPLTR